MADQKEKKVRVITGNEACAEGAIAAGLKFFAGYPITPSSEIAEVLAVHLPMVGGHFIQMEDEISAMGAIIGASLAGAKSMTATSGPGFSLKQENIGYASMVEVPCVVVNVMRGGPSTGLPTLVESGGVRDVGILDGVGIQAEVKVMLVRSIPGLPRQDRQLEVWLPPGGRRWRGRQPGVAPHHLGQLLACQ